MSSPSSSPVRLVREVSAPPSHLRSPTDTQGKWALVALVASFCAGAIIAGIYHSDIQQYAIDHPLKFTGYFVLGGAIFAGGVSHILFRNRNEDEEECPGTCTQHLAKVVAITLFAVSILFPAFGADCQKLVEMDGSVAAFVASGLLVGGAGYYGFLYNARREDENSEIDHSESRSQHDSQHDRTRLQDLIDRGDSSPFNARTPGIAQVPDLSEQDRRERQPEQGDRGEPQPWPGQKPGDAHSALLKVCRSDPH